MAAAQGLAEALAVRPQAGRSAWFSGTADARTATLTVPVTVPGTGPERVAGSARPALLEWRQFTDTQDSDTVTLQSTTDGTTWSTLAYQLGDQMVEGPYAVSGVRRWQRARAELPAGTTTVRWTYTQDATLSGRGVYLDGITVRDGRRVVVDTERHPDLVRAAGWVPARR